jgi:hypothetical protein
LNPGCYGAISRAGQSSVRFNPGLYLIRGGISGAIYTAGGSLSFSGNAYITSPATTAYTGTLGTVALIE